ncbi:hypothetical protein IZ6_10240 [Terrihabitans soli]|uniref:Uncharacterized protein n=1 Tax=Terrihabitans soli TaxID=708113 RepID=A0A6S6QMW0_9HYPH|nr:hypothetical protein [Terrihabitans soli]BCJ90289.1 hypothetical protein IZ6_10240 [Terrihabitans soli]
MADGLDQEKLTAFFCELTPAARARLSAAISSPAGAQIPFRDVILEPLLQAQRRLGEIPELVAPEQLLLAVIDPFTVADDSRNKTSGIISKTSRDRLAQWLVTTGAPDLVQELGRRLEGNLDKDAQDTAVDQIQDQLVPLLTEVLQRAETAKTRNRLAAQLGGDSGAEDLQDLIVALRRRALLEKFAAETHAPSGPVEEALKAIKARLDPVAIKYPDALSFALVLIRQKLPNPQTFVRLAAVAVETIDGGRIVETPYVRILDLALSEAEREHSSARRNTSTNERPAFLKAVRTFGATARALGTEIDLPPDGPHARKLATLRSEMAECVRSDLQDLSPRVRRLVRPRDKERNFEEHEVTRLLADIDLLLIARSYAEEIALNALSGRVYSEVKDLLDTGIPQLMERFRAANEKQKPDLRDRLKSIAKVSAKIFGEEYAQTLTKAISVAGQGPTPQPQARSA